MHCLPVSYHYELDALEVAKTYYNDQETYLQNNHQNDSFLSGLTAQAKGQVHRLAMVILAMDNAQKVLKDLKESRNKRNDENLSKKSMVI
ncbi:Hypothetical predicted protein [Mytilus galloprovincialis]|uniref:Uncharacterized protein n=1 Tax=Mytilus galloprovincialis TaxID=29158 RepID=A0A8B6BH51_MYTGA|nr:Hypothetical predicted protein [Mytilus galloprovincialis]